MMISSTDTNQASEDIDNILFEAIESAGSYIHKLTSTEADYIQEQAKEAILATIRTEKLKLLAEVRERVISEDVPEFHDPGCYQYNGLEYCHCIAKPDKATNNLRNEQREQLTKLEAELSQTLKEHKEKL